MTRRKNNAFMVMLMTLCVLFVVACGAGEERQQQVATPTIEAAEITPTQDATKAPTPTTEVTITPILQKEQYLYSETEYRYYFHGDVWVREVEPLRTTIYDIEGNAIREEIGDEITVYTKEKTEEGVLETWVAQLEKRTVTTTREQNAEGTVQTITTQTENGTDVITTYYDVDGLVIMREIVGRNGDITKSFTTREGNTTVYSHFEDEELREQKTTETDDEGRTVRYEARFYYDGVETIVEEHSVYDGDQRVSYICLKDGEVTYQEKYSYETMGDTVVIKYYQNDMENPLSTTTEEYLDGLCVKSTEDYGNGDIIVVTSSTYDNKNRLLTYLKKSSYRDGREGMVERQYSYNETGYTMEETTKEHYDSEVKYLIQEYSTSGQLLSSEYFLNGVLKDKSAYLEDGTRIYVETYSEEGDLLTLERHEYNEEGLLISHIQESSSQKREEKISYEYNAYGNLSSVETKVYIDGDLFEGTVVVYEYAEG